MADKKLTDLNTLTYATAADPDLLIIEDIDGSETKAITAENLGKYVLGNRTIGGTTAGDIVTIDGTQTLKNKTITSPKLNEDVAVTSSATEVNVLDGIDAALTAADLSLLKGLAAAGLTAADLSLLKGLAAAGLSNAELGYVNGVTSAIQPQINALAGAALAPARTFTYAEEWSNNASATKTITQATINTACSIPSGYYVDHTSIQCALYARDGDDYSLVLFTGGPTINFSRTNCGGVQGLDSIVLGGLTNDSTTDYLFNCTFRVVTASGA